jgi:hypothetical protein
MLAWVGVVNGELFRTGVAPLATVMQSLLFHWTVWEWGLPGTAGAASLGPTQSAVSRAVRREKGQAKEQGLAFPLG